MKDEFEKAPKTKAVPERVLRSQKGKVQPVAATSEEEVAQTTSEEAPVAEQEEPAGVDSYDLADPVAVLDKLPKNFFENLASSKWKERKEALDELYKIVNTPRIEDAKYGELASLLGKKCQDANILVVIQSVQCIECLAKGLRQAFSPYRGLVVSNLLERLKEKKPNVLEALRNALDAVFMSSDIHAFVEDYLTTMQHKNPQVKQEGIQWFVRCTKMTKKPFQKADIKQLAETLLKTIDDGDASVRDASAEALGMMCKLMGERAMTSFLEKLESIKKSKVMEFAGSTQAQTGSTATASAPISSLSLSGRTASKKSLVEKKVRRSWLRSFSDRLFFRSGLTTLRRKKIIRPEELAKRNLALDPFRRLI